MSADTPLKAFKEPEITLSESDGLRYLHFGTEWVQGAMRLGRPNDLPIEYNRQMMAWLLFMRASQSILQIGLGAASLTKFCLARLPGATLTVVEPSLNVVAAARQWFHLPPESRRFTLCVEEGEAFVRKQSSARFDIVQVDVYDALAQGPVLDSLEFYRGCRLLLAVPGILVVNLFGTHESFAGNVERLRQAFDGRVLELPQCQTGNSVLLGFNGPSFIAKWNMLESRAQLLERKLGLEADGWVKHWRETSTTGSVGLRIAPPAD